MKTDAEIKDDVIQELRWDPQVSEPEAIGVSVKDGAVTLTGRTSTYAEKAGGGPRRGTSIRSQGLGQRPDGQPVRHTARRLRHRHRDRPRLGQQCADPRRQVQAEVQAGWVTLRGQVEYDFQRREVERMVRNVRDAVGVTNLVTVNPPVTPERVEEAIEDTFSGRPRWTRATSGWRCLTTPRNSTEHVLSLHEANAGRLPRPPHRGSPVWKATSSISPIGDEVASGSRQSALPQFTLPRISQAVTASNRGECRKTALELTSPPLRRRDVWHARVVPGPQLAGVAGGRRSFPRRF